MTDPDPSSPGDPATAVLPERRRGRRRGRATGLADPGLVLVAAGLGVLVVSVAALLVGWVGVLLAVVLVQVVAARAWVSWLEVPGAALCAAAVVAVAAVTDVGVLVVRAATDPVHERADGLDQLVPGLGAVFLLAVLAQLLRRDDDPGGPDGSPAAEAVPAGPRPGAVAGIVAVTTGGALVVGLALWVPMLASRSGGGLVLAGTALVATVSIVVGATGWVRGSSVPPAAVLVPVLLAAVAGPLYVVGRLTSG